MRLPLVLLTIVFCLILTGCNYFARTTGGNVTIDLPPNTKLISVQWREKNSSLWYLTRPMRSDEYPETYTFQEDSNIGVLEGTVTINERREKK